LKKRKYLNDSVDKLTAFISPHAASPVHSATETFVNKSFEVQDKKLHKRKRKRHKEDVSDRQKQCKYRRVECDNVNTSAMNVKKGHCCESSSQNHTCNETLPNQLFNLVPETKFHANGEQQKHKKRKRKKKKILQEPASDKHSDCKQLHKHKRKKKSKKMWHKDIVSHSDVTEQNSLHLPVPSAIVVCNGEAVSSDTTAAATEDEQVLLVNKLEVIGSDDAKYVECVYQKHKSEQQKMNKDLETETADHCPEVSSYVQSEISNLLPAEKPASDQCLNNADVLNLLHAENSLSYMKTKFDVEEQGTKKNTMFYCSTIVLLSVIIIELLWYYS